jgi:hypothetical protein
MSGPTEFEASEVRDQSQNGRIFQHEVIFNQLVRPYLRSGIVSQIVAVMHDEPMYGIGMFGTRTVSG